MDKETVSLPQTSLALRARLEFVIQALGADAPKTLLDIGCGTGEHLTGPLARALPATRIVGVEPHPETLAHARRIHRRLANLVFLPDQPPRATFDAVVASEVLEHVLDPHAFVSRLWDCLNPNGVLVVTVPNGYGCSEMMAILETLSIRSGLWPWLRRVKRSLSRTKSVAHVGADTMAISPHANFFSLGRVQRLLRQGGFDLESASGRMLFHNFICSNILNAFEPLAEGNAWLGKHLPKAVVADWMFALRKNPDRKPNFPAPYRRNLYERLKIRFHRWGACQ